MIALLWLLVGLVVLAAVCSGLAFLICWVVDTRRSMVIWIGPIVALAVGGFIAVVLLFALATMAVGTS